MTKISIFIEENIDFHRKNQFLFRKNTCSKYGWKIRKLYFSPYVKNLNYTFYIYYADLVKWEEFYQNNDSVIESDEDDEMSDEINEKIDVAEEPRVFSIVTSKEDEEKHKNREKGLPGLANFSMGVAPFERNYIDESLVKKGTFKKINKLLNKYKNQ